MDIWELREREKFSICSYVDSDGIMHFKHHNPVDGFYYETMYRCIRVNTFKYIGWMVDYGLEYRHIRCHF